MVHLDKEFEKEIVGRLSGVEVKLDMLIEDNKKIDNANELAREALLSSKSAHHRIDEYKEGAEKERRDKERAFDKYKESIRWTVGITVTIASVILGLIEHFI